MGLAVENVENVESGRRNSEEQQKAPLTFRLNAPQVSLMNNGEQVLDRPLRGLGALRPLPWGLARRAAGDCGPYRGPLGAKCT